MPSEFCCDQNYYTDKIIPTVRNCIDIEWSFETIQQQRINLSLLYRSVVYHMENIDQSRSPYIYAGIVYNTWISQNRCEYEWIF